MPAPIKIYNSPDEPHWDMLKSGAEMSLSERYQSFFLMQKRLRAINGIKHPKPWKITFRDINGSGG